MKRQVISLFALTAALSLSAFTNSDSLSGKNTSYYWFKVGSGQGANSSFVNSQASLMPGGPSVSPPASSDCIGTGKKCVVGFTLSQLNATQTALDTGPSDNIPQTPAIVGRTRTNP